MRTSCTLALVLACTAPAAAQQVSASLDTNAIRIGGVATYTVSMRLPAGIAAAEVVWPTITDTLTRRLEVIGPIVQDGADSSGTVGIHCRITSWDTGTYAIPPSKVIVQGRTIESNALVLQVIATPVDMRSAPKPLKDIPPMPFSIRMWLLMHRVTLLIVAAVGLLIAAMIWFLRKRARRPLPAPQAAPPPPPPHVQCLEALDALEKQRLWQQGEHKAYQSRITDLLRGYIEARYSVSALERTTEELMSELRVSPLPGDERIRLDNMLRAADLVKFAKAVPSAPENEQLLASARQFVRATAQTDAHTP
jgi:hypothetical protein